MTIIHNIPWRIESDNVVFQRLGENASDDVLMIFEINNPGTMTASSKPHLAPVTWNVLCNRSARIYL